MRPWTKRVYGIPPEQVIGSSIKRKHETRDGKPAIVRLPEFLETSAFSRRGFYVSGGATECNRVINSTFNRAIDYTINNVN